MSIDCRTWTPTVPLAKSVWGSTRNVPSNLTKGSGTNLSAVIYGNFADLLIGMFGQLEILVDPYTDFAKGTVGVRALQSIDIAVRHAESFAAM